MKLRDDIRGLDRQSIRRDKRLNTACHEAAHALLYLRENVPFVKAVVYDKPERGLLGEVTCESNFTYDRDEIHRAALTHVAGWVFERIMNPHDTERHLVLTGAAGDWENTAECVGWLYPQFDERQLKSFIKRKLVPQVRARLVADWSAILRIGRALSEAGELRYTQVRSLVQ